MVILLQGLTSSNTTITQRLIVTRCTEIDVSYIDYLPLLQVVTVLELQGNHKRRVQSRVWRQYTKGPLGQRHIIPTLGVL